MIPAHWPYSQHEGVGLHLVGVPRDPETFVFKLAKYGCHPSASRRIVQRLTANGQDWLTVQYQLPFEDIHKTMTEAGVTMTIIPPQDGWHQRFNDGPWPEKYLPKEFA